MNTWLFHFFHEHCLLNIFLIAGGNFLCIFCVTGESSMMMLVAISYSIVPQHDDMADDNIVYSVKY